MTLAVLSLPAVAAMITGSRGPSSARYRVGAPIADNAPIRLLAGDEIKVLDGRGVKILTGPGRGTVALFRAAPGRMSERMAKTAAVVDARDNRGTTIDPSQPDALSPPTEMASAADVHGVEVAEERSLNILGRSYGSSLVIRSSGAVASAYPPGKSIPAGQELALAAGDQLTLLDGRGTRVLSGPGHFNAPSAAVENRLPVLASLFPGGSDKRVRIGAVRGVATPRPPSLWHVDTRYRGNVCVVDAAKVSLWRDVIDRDQTLIVGDATGKTTRIAWPKGSDTLTWPAGLPVTNGAEYTLALDGRAPVKIRFVLLDSRPAGLEETAAALIRGGCQRQIDVLSDTFAVPSDPAK